MSIADWLAEFNPMESPEMAFLDQNPPRNHPLRSSLQTELNNTAVKIKREDTKLQILKQEENLIQ